MPKSQLLFSAVFGFRNPSKEIFAELDEINTQVPILPGSIQNTRESERSHVGPTHGGGAAPGRAALVSGPTRPLPRLPFRLQIASVPKPPVPRATIRKTFQTPPPRIPSRGIQKIASGTLPERGFISGGLFIAMIASGVMSAPVAATSSASFIDLEPDLLERHRLLPGASSFVIAAGACWLMLLAGVLLAGWCCWLMLLLLADVDAAAGCCCSNVANNEEAGGSGSKPFWMLTDEMEVMESQPRRDDGEDDGTDPEYRADDAAEDDTTDGAGEDDTTDGAGEDDTGAPKKLRRERRPNVLSTVKQAFTKVNASGHPTAPPDLVKGYAAQLGCILRSTVSINTENLRHPDRANLRTLLFKKLHERYEFPVDCSEKRLMRNKVHNAALTKMSTALASWREENDSERVAQPKWDTADEERVKNGLEPLFSQYKNKQTRNFLLARYRIDPKTKELTTTPEVKEFEALLAKEVAAESEKEASSGAGSSSSSQCAPWDNTLNRALNAHKKRDPLTDPFYMRAVHLATAGDRAVASEYLKGFFLANQKKYNLLLPVFPEDNTCTLISVTPRHSMATYLDADGKSSTDYTNVKAVLDDALNGYVRAKGHMERPNVRYGKHVFKHQTKFPCVKKPPSSTKDAYYALYHMNKFIRDQQQLTLPEHLRDWANKLARVPDDGIKQDFFRIQTEFCEIIHQDVIRSAGEFYAGYQPSNNMTWYVVYKGKVPGVYNDWEECRRQMAPPGRASQDAMMQLLQTLMADREAERAERQANIAALQQIAQNNQGHGNHDHPGSKLKNFQNTNSPVFSKTEEPLDADDWLQTMENNLEVAGVEANDKVLFAMHYLAGPARAWWTSARALNAGQMMTWADFKLKFSKYHVPPGLIKKMRDEFRELKQGRMTVVEYRDKFLTLSRYAPDETDTTDKRKERFLNGLHDEMHTVLVNIPFADLEALVDSAIQMEGKLNQANENRKRRMMH
ncbi:hypothetical protein QYE76_022028 [Lolium multiflorum]|uniref:Retrotransposon gag domain-containing protein n=1 Tax=Lolium multiflorum TaxID=4521 RepID=A0AAD8R9G6_LOLMU|nr:hypothetical protein QYE76_022028 [Lolium multiflorum]